MRKVNHWWVVIRLALFITCMSFSCEKEHIQTNVPRGTLDTIYGIITVNHPELPEFVMIGALSNGIYYRLTLTKTNTSTKANIDTVFFADTPTRFVKSFKRF